MVSPPGHQNLLTDRDDPKGRDRRRGNERADDEAAFEEKEKVFFSLSLHGLERAGAESVGRERCRRDIGAHSDRSLILPGVICASMYQEILVPTDGDAPSEAAAEHAIDIASRCDARIHTLYVVDVDAVGPVDFGGSVVVSGLESEGETATTAVAEAAEAVGVRVRKAIVDGSPAETILEYVESEGIDLVVMGTHGRRGLDRLLLGSVAQQVVRRAPVPVLVVRGSEGDEGPTAEEGAGDSQSAPEPP